MGRPDSTGRKILVVGGAGFIGSHLCESLLSLGHQVFCMDSKITGSEQNLKTFRDNPLFSFYEGNAAETGEMEHACGEGSEVPDEIYYLASIASPVKYLEYPNETIDANVWGLRNALELADGWGARLLYTSTSEVYGDPEEMPQKEEYNGNVDPTTDRAVYDESKRLGETLCFMHQRTKNTDVVVVRIFNTYGPRMDASDGRVVPAFIKAALANDAATIYGDGEQTRCFCYIDDMVDGLLAAMSKGEIGPFNLGNPDEYYSVNDLHQIINEMLGCTHRAAYREHVTQNDPVERMPDIRFAKRFLKWYPRIKIETGLKETVEFFKNGSTGLDSDPK